MDLLDDRPLLECETYEDYLDLFVQPQDLFYLRDCHMARRIVALGYRYVRVFFNDKCKNKMSAYRSAIDVLTREQFMVKKDKLLEQQSTKNQQHHKLFSSSLRSTDPMLIELAVRERANRLGMINVNFIL